MEIQSNNSFKSIFKRVQILLVAILSVLALSTAFLPKIKERMALLQKREDLLSKISEMEKEIEELRKREIALQSNPHYVEKLARNKLGYSKPNEIIYKFE